MLYCEMYPYFTYRVNGGKVVVNKSDRKVVLLRTVFILLPETVILGVDNFPGR